MGWGAETAESATFLNTMALDHAPIEELIHTLALLSPSRSQQCTKLLAAQCT